MQLQIICLSNPLPLIYLSLVEYKLESINLLGRVASLPLSLLSINLLGAL